MILHELKILAKKKKQEGSIKEALALYEKIWEKEKNAWNGYFLAQCLRKTEKFDDARKLHEELKITYPTFEPLKNDKLWLDYSEKIKDWDNLNLIKDAEDILSRADKYDKWTSTVYTKTVLKTVRYLIKKNLVDEAYEWLLKLDQDIISNSIFSYNGQKYPADRKIFFILYADVLIKLNMHLNYIEQCLSDLNFKQSNLSEFIKKIKEDITFENYNGGEYISRSMLGRYIKDFQEEYNLRVNKKIINNYSKEKTTLISDLSHYLFCPASFAINETYHTKVNESWEQDEWLGKKKLFIDRHKKFKLTKKFEEVFADLEINIDSQIKSDFEYLFNSDIKVNNATNPKPTIYSNNSKNLKGAPDYIMQDSSGTIFAITEKFSSIHSADSKTPFDSDLVKHYAYIDELEKSKISFGYLITWYYTFKDIENEAQQIKKKLTINSYRITKIEKKKENSNKLKMTIEKVNNFKATGILDIEGERLSYANKCLKCSVSSYCNHKTGSFSSINLPYDLNQNKISGESIIKFDIGEDFLRF